MPRMKASRAKTSTTARRHTRARKTTRSKVPFGAAMVLLAVVCVLGAAMVIAARDPSRPTATASTGSVQDTADAIPAVTAKPRTTATPAATRASEVPATNASLEETPAPTAGRTPAPVTIAGCLARSGDAYQLKNTSGTSAPKARSWKSGFLRKGGAAIDLVEAARTARLRDHIGERVSVTGVLVDREMQVRSLQRLSSSCN